MNTIKYFLTILLVSSLSLVFAQSANEEKELFEGFDFRSQSGFASLSPGDTTRMNIVVYSGQDFRIFVLGDPNLGELKFRIVSKTKKNTKKVKEVNKSEKTLYKTDEKGQELYDNNYNKIVDKTVTVYDTVWTYSQGFDETILFDSETNKEGKIYWQKTIAKTERLIIEVIVPDSGDATYIGEVEVYVGRRPKKDVSVKRY